MAVPGPSRLGDLGMREVQPRTPGKGESGRVNQPSHSNMTQVPVSTNFVGSTRRASWRRWHRSGDFGKEDEVDACTPSLGNRLGKVSTVRGCRLV